MKFKRKFFPKKLKTTREGKITIAISIAIGIAAINSGNNLLYLIFGFLLSIIVVSGILSEVNLKRIKVRRIGEEKIWALSPSLFYIEIESKKRKINSWTVEVIEIFENEKIKQIPASFLNIPPRTKNISSISLVFPSRGKYLSHGIKVRTKYPFSFFEKSIYFYEDKTFIVYPPLASLIEVKKYLSSIGEEDEFEKIGKGEEYYGVREMQKGDEPKAIHWKLTAKKKRKIVIEFFLKGEKKAFIFLLNAVPKMHKENLEKIEKLISISATIAKYLIESDYRVGFYSLSNKIECDGGLLHLHKILSFIALLPVFTMNEKEIKEKIAEFYFPPSTIFLMTDSYSK